MNVTIQYLISGTAAVCMEVDKCEGILSTLPLFAAHQVTNLISHLSSMDYNMWI